MGFKRFRVFCTIRVIALVLSIACLFFLFEKTTLYATMVVNIGAILYQIYSLIVYVERTNRDITRFLEAIEYSDFSDNFSTGLAGKSFDELNHSFSRVLQRFRDVRQEREENFHYLQTVIQHIGIGLIAYRDNGDVELVNSAARRLLQIPVINNIDSLAEVNPELPDRLRHTKPGQRLLITITSALEPQQVAILTTQLNLRERRITLASFQNITSELSAKEMDAWQNLIRVLTHEIRNSLTPISSLAATIEDTLSSEKDNPATDKQDGHQDIIDALGTIRRRSDGLLNFVDSYRRLTRIPKPSLATFPVAMLIQETVRLIQPQASSQNIKITYNISPIDLTVVGDIQLIGQALMNLILNAIEALAGQQNGVIEVRAFHDNNNRARITVTDNGPGIVPEALERIFVPFYTTKKGGSGIGLSFSRQIMRMHQGGLTVSSEPGVQTTASMIF